MTQSASREPLSFPSAPLPIEPARGTGVAPVLRRHCRRGRRILRCRPPLLLLLSLHAACSLPLGARAADWSVADADARIPLIISGDLYLRASVASEIVLDFNTLLGARRVLAAASLALIDAATGEHVPLDLAQDARVRYATGNPILRLRWETGPLDRFEDRAWHLYFRTVPPRDPDAWVPLDATFVPGPPDLLLATSFEEADPDRPDRPMYMVPGGRDVEGETTERVWSDQDAHTGTRALKISRVFADEPPANTNRPHWRTWPPPIAVRPGQNLHLSAWLKATEFGENGMASVMLEFYGPENQRLAEGRLWLRGPRIPYDWTELSGATTVPPGAAWAVIWFSLHSQGTAFCDDLRVTRVPGGDLPDLPVAAGALQDRAAFTAAQDQRPEGKILACAAADRPPTIDGALDDPCWASAGRIDDFVEHTRVPGTTATTTVLACADRDALYFGFECTEPTTDALIAHATERDGRLWEDDSVELFLDTNRDRQTYYQIIVNSRGVIFDQDTGAPGLAGPGWDGPVTAAARVLPDRWTAEVKLEFAGLRLAEAEGQVWGANFARSSFREGRSLYVWAPVGSNFGEPGRFGEIVLPFDPTANAVTGRPLAGRRIFWASGSLPFEVNNRRDRPATVRVTATQLPAGAAEPMPLGEATATIAARSAVEVPIACAFTHPGEVRVRYDLTEADRGRLLYTTVVTHTVPEPLTLQPSTLVSWLGEDRLSVGWELGLAESALPGVHVSFRIVPAAGDDPPTNTGVAPSAIRGSSALPVADLAPGDYVLQARLLRGDDALGEAAFRFRRTPGPFSPSP